jgi:hypothetical protein
MSELTMETLMKAVQDFEALFPVDRSRVLLLGRKQMQELRDADPFGHFPREPWGKGYCYRVGGTLVKEVMLDDCPGIWLYSKCELGS